MSLTERFDLSKPMGKAMLHIMAAIAQMERDIIQERTKAGVRAAIGRGFKFPADNVAMYLQRSGP